MIVAMHQAICLAVFYVRRNTSNESRAQTDVKPERQETDTKVEERTATHGLIIVDEEIDRKSSQLVERWR